MRVSLIFRVRILEAVKTQNLNDLAKLDRDRETVMAATSQLKMKCEEAYENQQALTSRFAIHYCFR